MTRAFVFTSNEGAVLESNSRFGYWLWILDAVWNHLMWIWLYGLIYRKKGNFFQAAALPERTFSSEMDAILS